MLLVSPGLLYIFNVKKVFVYTYMTVPLSPSIVLMLLLFLEQLREEAVRWTRSPQS